LISARKESKRSSAGREKCFGDAWRSGSGWRVKEIRYADVAEISFNPEPTATAGDGVLQSVALDCGQAWPTRASGACQY
jgi:hypothetical protein